MSAAGWQYPKLAQCLISDKFTTCQSARSCYNKSINLGRPPWLGSARLAAAGEILINTLFQGLCCYDGTEDGGGTVWGYNTVHLATLSTLPSQMSSSRADFGCPLDLNMGRFYKRCCIQMKFFPTHRNLFWSVLFSFLSILCASFQSLDKTFPTVPAPCHRELWTVAASSPPPATDWINNKPRRSTWTETCYLLLVRLYSTYNKDVGLSFLPDRCRS